MADDGVPPFVKKQEDILHLEALAWHEYADHWIIIFSPGRKLRFPKPIETVNQSKPSAHHPRKRAG